MTPGLKLQLEVQNCTLQGTTPVTATCTFKGTDFYLFFLRVYTVDSEKVKDTAVFQSVQLSLQSGCVLLILSNFTHSILMLKRLNFPNKLKN